MWKTVLIRKNWHCRKGPDVAVQILPYLYLGKQSSGTKGVGERGPVFDTERMRMRVSKAGDWYGFWHVNGISLHCEAEAADVAITVNPWREQSSLGTISAALPEAGGVLVFT